MPDPDAAEARPSGAGGGRTYALATDPACRVVLLDVGLACCAVEVGAAITRGLLVPVPADAPPPERHVLLVSGTVTDALAPAVLAAWRALPGSAAVVSFGACSNSGGPYWDSYAVMQGVDQLLPVSVYVPGCPPRPEAVAEALAAVAAVPS